MASAIIVGSLGMSATQTTDASVGQVAHTKKVYTVNDLPPELYRICSCESMQGGSKPPTQYDSKGNVLRGRQNHSDIGACQVNLYYHEDAAKKLNLDLFVESDNLEYAIDLYTAEGNQPWFWSKGCWGK